MTESMTESEIKTRICANLRDRIASYEEQIVTNLERMAQLSELNGHYSTHIAQIRLEIAGYEESIHAR